jgi:metal-sulfur cluster biosynthetic enzyme
VSSVPIPQPTADALVDALRQVLDPCSIGMGSPIDIVDMGLLDDLEIMDDGRVRVVLLLTDFSCPHYTGLRHHIVDVLADLSGVTAVDVELATHALWTPDRIRRHSPVGSP